MTQPDVIKVGLEIGDCFQFDLENGTLKVFRPYEDKNSIGRRTREGDDKILYPGTRDKNSTWSIVEVVLFSIGMSDFLIDDISTEYGNRPDTLVTFQIKGR